MLTDFNFSFLFVNKTHYFYQVDLLELDDNTLKHLSVFRLMSFNKSYKNNAVHQIIRSEIVCKGYLVSTNTQGLICYKKSAIYWNRLNK